MFHGGKKFWKMFDIFEIFVDSFVSLTFFHFFYSKRFDFLFRKFIRNCFEMFSIFLKVYFILIFFSKVIFPKYSKKLNFLQFFNKNFIKKYIFHVRRYIIFFLACHGHHFESSMPPPPHNRYTSFIDAIRAG